MPNAYIIFNEIIQKQNETRERQTTITTNKHQASFLPTSFFLLLFPLSLLSYSLSLYFFSVARKIILAWNAKFPRLIRKYTRKLFTSFVLTRQKKPQQRESEKEKQDEAKRTRHPKKETPEEWILHFSACPSCLLCFLNYHHHRQNNNNITKQSRFVLCKSDRREHTQCRGGMMGSGSIRQNHNKYRSRVMPFCLFDSRAAKAFCLLF